ncbi:MAG: succinate--CoA ligase subunit alpha [Armatimonadota bacterium]|nr:succinate--CoA ligase subunit alpha [Armatimonadota bacterium]MDW8103749.1 succinate--CoA ligase subunit alpha [Armatimonadota bacterium]
MAILVDQNTRVLVQGITGREGEFHTRQMLEYGTRVVAGVTPGKGGQEVLGVPVYDTVKQAVAATGADTSVIFVPAPFAADAVLEAAEAGIRLVVCITEGIPVQDMVKTVALVRQKGVRLIGPNCPGLVTAGQCKVGIMPGNIFTPGPVGLISRSGTLTYEIVDLLTKAGLGQSTCIGIGGDPVLGSTFVDLLPLFEQDPDTQAVVLVGEIGGSDEEIAAEYIRTMRKPVVGFISGRTAPPGKRMGHAGAIISGRTGTPQAKVDALRAAGVPVADALYEIPDLVKQALAHRP